MRSSIGVAEAILAETEKRRRGNCDGRVRFDLMLALASRLLRPCLRVNAVARPVSTACARLSTLPNLPLFRALQNHDPASLAVEHSSSSRAFTYGSLVADVSRVQRDLELHAAKTAGNLAGERVAFLAENSYDYVVTLLAIFASDAIALPLSPAFPVSELQYILDNSQAKLLLATEKYAEKATQIVNAGLKREPLLNIRRKIHAGANPEPVELEDMNQSSSGGMMLYTSGTTNRPKGVLIPNSALAAQASSLISAWNYSPKIDFFTSCRSTIFMGPSPQSISASTSPGSAALPTPTKAAWKDLSNGNVLLERFGMTEVGMAISCGLDFCDRVDGSVGWPLPGVEARLVDTDTDEVIPETQERDSSGRLREGEIQLRGPSIFHSYWANEAATRESFVADSHGGSWFRTGDVATRRVVDGAGGRKSVDIIKTAGEKISALEVERELLSLPQVAEAAVVGLPSEQWGQKVAAVLVLRADAATSGRNGRAWGPMDMRRALKDRLASYKIPQEMKVLDSIPRNAMGKVNKKALLKEVFGV
ncbi:hypothetical protein N7470_006832 [Penicillium chermesinum]|nr:hypothetical protein N7470_006832 [Penicillium chermesinum]